MRVVNAKNRLVFLSLSSLSSSLQGAGVFWHDVGVDTPVHDIGIVALQLLYIRQGGVVETLAYDYFHPPVIGAVFIRGVGLNGWASARPTTMKRSLSSTCRSPVRG